jgi:hypothetical protein
MNFLAGYGSDDDDNDNNADNEKRPTLNDDNNANNANNANDANDANDNDANDASVRNPLLAGLPAPRHSGVKRGASDADDVSTNKRVAATTASAGTGGLIGSRLRDEPKAVAKPSGPITFQSIDVDAVAERGRELEQKRLADEQIARECAPRTTETALVGDAAAPKRSMFAALLPAPKHATSAPVKHAVQHAAGIELGNSNSGSSSSVSSASSINNSDSNAHRDASDAPPLLAAPTLVDDASVTTTNTYTEVSLLFYESFFCESFVLLARYF